jgi:hypothetical protein
LLAAWRLQLAAKATALTGLTNPSSADGVHCREWVA